MQHEEPRWTGIALEAKCSILVKMEKKRRKKTHVPVYAQVNGTETGELHNFSFYVSL